jgi:hypothetical protein
MKNIALFWGIILTIWYIIRKTKTCLKLKDSHEWVTDCCLTSHVHFDKDEDVYLVLEQHAEMDWYK